MTPCKLALQFGNCVRCSVRVQARRSMSAATPFPYNSLQPYDPPLWAKDLKHHPTEYIQVAPLMIDCIILTSSIPCATDLVLLFCQHLPSLHAAGNASHSPSPLAAARGASWIPGVHQERRHDGQYPQREQGVACRPSSIILYPTCSQERGGGWGWS